MLLTTYVVTYKDILGSRTAPGLGQPRLRAARSVPRRPGALRGNHLVTRPGSLPLPIPGGRQRDIVHGPVSVANTVGEKMGAGKLPGALRGNHLSNATCLTQGFFKSGESYSKLKYGDP